jgi:hypothetical protein
MSMLAVRDEDVALDIKALRVRVAEALAAVPSSRDTTSTWAWVEATAQAQFLAIVQRTLVAMTPENGLVTWRDVAANARTQATVGGTQLFVSLAIPLRAAATGHAYAAGFLIAACNLMSVLLVRFISRPVAKPRPESA